MFDPALLQVEKSLQDLRDVLLIAVTDGEGEEVPGLFNVSWLPGLTG